MNVTITAADASRRVVALRLLFARSPVEQQQARLEETLLSVERGTLNIDHLLLAESDGLPVGATLVMFQADGVALVWPPVVSCGATDPSLVESALMDEVCRRCDAAAVKLAQALLDPTDEAEAALLERHGFAHAADMFFLARMLTPEDVLPQNRIVDESARQDLGSAAQRESNESDANRPSHYSVTTFSNEAAPRFAYVIEESYRHSLDLISLQGFRTGMEALDSHRLSGVFAPQHWLLYSHCNTEIVGPSDQGSTQLVQMPLSDRDAGVILVNDHPDQGSAELTYLGVTPAARGRGLGRIMLRNAMHSAAQRGRTVLFLAVDCENNFANALYAEFSFVELARRRIVLRRSGEPT